VFGNVARSLSWKPLLHAETLLEFVAFPILIPRESRGRHDDHQIAHELIDFYVSSYIEENDIVSERHFLDQELLAVTTSIR
jgi:hypothetical protein